MYYVISEVTLEQNAILLESTPNGFYVIDESFLLYKLDKNRYYTLSHTLKIDDQNLSKSHLAISKNLHFALANRSNFGISIYKIENQECKNVITLNWHKIDISLLFYSPEGSYLASADDSGYIFLYDSSKYTLCAIPKKAKNRIASAAFSDDERFLVYIDDAGVLYVYDIFLNINIFETNLDTKEKIISIIFTKYNTFIIFFENRWIYVCDISKKSILRLDSNLARVIEVSYYTQENLFMVAIRDGSIFSIKIEQNSVIKKYICLIDKIKKFKIDNKFLIISLNEPLIRVIDIHKYLIEAEMNYKVKNYQKMQEYISKNSFLILLESMNQKVNKAWIESRDEAIKQIHDNNILRAHKICAPFLENSEMLKEFNELKNFAKELRFFYKLIKDKKIEDAYRFVQSYPFLKQTPRYEELEKYWQNSFMAAKKLIYKDTHKYTSICEKLLAPFMFDTEKRELSLLLLKQPELFIRLDNAIKHLNFKLFFSIIQKNPVLKSLDIYHKMLVYGNDRLNEIKKLQKNKDYKSALEKTKEMLGFLPYEEEIKELHKELELSLNAIEFSQALNVYEIVKMLANEYVIYSSEILKDHKTKIFDTFKRSMDASLKGNVKEALSYLSPYLKNIELLSKISFILRVGYINELILAKSKALNVDWEASIGKYLERFGDDLLIRRFLERFKAQRLIESLKEIIDPNGYKTLGFLDSVVVLKNQKKA